MAAFDIDKMQADFEPVDIVFRGETYTLGRNALGLMNACEMQGSIDDKDGLEYLKANLEMQPRVLQTLCPEWDAEVELTTGEQMALMKVITEVLGRAGRLTFQEEDEGGSAES